MHLLVRILVGFGSSVSIYSTPYKIVGYFGEPLLIISIAILTVGLYGSWLKYHKPIALIAVIVGILYILERVFWSYVTINNHVSSAVLTAFIISMVINNFGIVLIGVGLLTESLR